MPGSSWSAQGLGPAEARGWAAARGPPRGVKSSPQEVLSSSGPFFCLGGGGGLGGGWMGVVVFFLFFWSFFFFGVGV